MSVPVRVGITHGDLNGISYEIILKAFSREGITEVCTPVLFCSAKLLGYFRKMFNVEDFRYNQVRGGAIKDGEVNVVNISDEEFKVTLGETNAEAGRASVLALDMAIEMLKQGDIDVLVTAPINKNAVHSEKFPFTGHTEYLGAQLAENGESPLMVMSSEDMRVALVTTHLPLSKVSENITMEKVESTIRVFEKSLKRDFAIDKPTIAVLSLNPHKGDGGILGNEETESIIPAMKKCCDDGILAFGPFAADGFFGSGSYKKYDGIVAMYHDQGLTPFKALSGERGVNFTANLPYVRTSPDHGTGYDIVGKGIADEASLLAAVYMAIDVWRNRERDSEAHRNPLKKQFVERGADKSVDLTKEEEATD